MNTIMKMFFVLARAVLHSRPSPLARKNKTSQHQRRRPLLRTRHKVRNMQSHQRAMQRVILRNMRLLATNQP